MLEILSNNTGRSVAELSKNSDRMSYLTPYAAVEYGPIDRVVSSQTDTDDSPATGTCASTPCFLPTPT